MMNKLSCLALAFALALPLTASAQQGLFDFNTPEIAGANTASARMTGAGAYDADLSLIDAGGSFRCTSDVNQGPLNGCKTGEGIRWHSVALLPSAPFKCTTAATESGKTEFTSEDTVVFLADFYRTGAGRDEPFTAKVIVSTRDIAGDVGGAQNVWIQGVGCGAGVVNVD
jgi:hypothetical protein